MSAKYQNPDDDPRGPYVAVDLTAPLFRPSLVFEWHCLRGAPQRTTVFPSAELAPTCEATIHDVRECVVGALGLGRLNWNTSDLRSSQPVTLGFAKRVGGIMAYTDYLPKQGPIQVIATICDYRRQTRTTSGTN